jgi:hypothetical protein
MSEIIGTTSLEKQSPCVTLELDKDVAKTARQFKPGQVVKVTLIGTIESLSFRKPDDPEEKGFEGHLSLAAQKMEIGLSQKNAIAELLDDDE